MKKVTNKDFFKENKPLGEATNTADRAERPQTTTSDKPSEAPVANRAPRVNVRRHMSETIGKAHKTLVEYGFAPLARRLDEVYASISKETFTVGIVGEFSRGKSTFINKLIGKDLLPAANLPTTAILTRIRYGNQPTLTTYSSNGSKQKVLPLNEQSWDGLTALGDNPTQPEGYAIVRVPDRWLGANGIELIDTPGAGDLEDRRVRVLSDALMGCDGVLIAISAQSALSLSEKTFIEQRLIAKKMPFMAIIVNKLDLVSLSERNDVIHYIHNRLKVWGINIPVLIPTDIEMPDDKYAGIIGMDKVRDLIISWAHNPKRADLVETWLSQRTNEILDQAIDTLLNEKAIYMAKDDERKNKINANLEKLAGFAAEWETLRTQMLKRAVECGKQIDHKATTLTQNVIERLQFEVKHANDPKKWVEEDYPYRLKIELANMSVGLENTANKIIRSDMVWLNRELAQRFHAQSIQVDETQGDINSDINFMRKMELTDLGKKRIAASVGTAVATIGVAMAMAASGGLALIGTIGVSTGASIITNTIFKKKVDEQRQQVCEFIAKQVPIVVTDAISECDTRIKIIYNDIIEESLKTESAWIANQKAAINKAAANTAPQALNDVDQRIKSVEALKQELNTPL